MSSSKDRKRIRLERRSPFYWRVTFDHPPLNIFGPESIPAGGNTARVYNVCVSSSQLFACHRSIPKGQAGR